MQVNEWLLSKLEPLNECPSILVRDSLRLLPEKDGRLHSFARAHNFTVIVAATNLVFRELYEHALADPETKKLLVIDRAPARRREQTSGTKAPPPFYPDLLATTPPEARIELDLRQFLKETTHDLNWPQEANNPRYARLLMRHLDGVLEAHRQLRVAHKGRFTDTDFQRIVAFSALGVGSSAFKQLDARDYWKIGLLGHEALEELDSLAPEVTRTIKEELGKASAPFSWLATRDPDIVIRAFYLSVILAQHLENWPLLLPTIDPTLARMEPIKEHILQEAAPMLVALDPGQAQRDLDQVEQSLDRTALHFLLFDQMKLTTPDGWVAALEHERYSTLLRCLALLLALDNLLAANPARAQHEQLKALLFAQSKGSEGTFAEKRHSIAWSNLQEAYRLALEIVQLRDALVSAVRETRLKKPEELSFADFWSLWNGKQINRLEYYVSTLKRLVESAELTPRLEEDLPAEFGKAVKRIQQQTMRLYEDLYKQLDDLNRCFQNMVAVQYPAWVAKDSEVVLTSQFLRRCLKAHWDSKKEKAVVFVFDGMRYDIWDEMLRPLLEDRMELVADLEASSLLPSETHISRWALAAGAEPRDFYPRKAENAHLKESLAQELNYLGKVEAVAPDGAGTGETVRYQAGNLEYYIFELCDKELHKIQLRKLPDGREEPSRPLSFIYQQLIKNFIEHEVMAIVRRLSPGTKVFVTADHGFGPVRDEPLWFESSDLNDHDDCSYRNCWLKVPIDQANLPKKVVQNIIAFTPDQLRMPKKETTTDRVSGLPRTKEYRAIAFPRVGYSFSRRGSPYHPSAYSHGGISLQEMLIPMAVLRVKPREDSILTLGSIAGPDEVIEGQELEFRLRLTPNSRGGTLSEPLRVDVEAAYSLDPERFSLPQQVLYVPSQGAEVVYRFMPPREDATDEELRQGRMERWLTITASYRDGRRVSRKIQTHRFAVQLNLDRVIRRVPTNLGNILGLMPKNMG